MKDTVQYESPFYGKWLELTQLPRTLYDGTKGMKDAGDTYLPKHPLETDIGYNLRLEQSTLLNAFMKTCGFLGGQVFQADIIFDDTVPEDFIELMKDCDVKKNNINVFCKRAFVNGIAKGVSHILVDAPERYQDNVLSMEEEKAAGIRPYIREICPEDVIGGKFQDGLLTQVRIKGTREVEEGKYMTGVKEQVYVYNTDGTWEVWEEPNPNEEMVMVKSGTSSYNGIPIVTFIPGEELSPLTGKSPLDDLAELNLGHWRSASDQTNILSVARVPQLFGRHIDIATMPVGVAAIITSDVDGSDIKYVEITGAGAISAGANDIKEREAAMALYGLQQLLPRSGNMTATEKALSSRESNSSLATWVVEYEDCLQEVFEIFQMMRGQEFPKEAILLNREYNLGIVDTQEGMLLLQAAKDQVISNRVAFTELRRRGVLDEGSTWDEILVDIEEEGRGEPDLGGFEGGMF